VSMDPFRLQETWMAETKAKAETAFDAFIESYQVKYEKAAVSDRISSGARKPAPKYLRLKMSRIT
jgi:hypothetical protein